MLTPSNTLSSSTSPIALVLDAACDVPAAFLHHPSVRLLPARIHIGDHLLLDDRTPEHLPIFYREYLQSSHAVSAYTEPAAPDQLQALLQDELFLRFAAVIGVFVSSTRSKYFENALEGLRHAQTPSGAECPVAVLDSLALFAGYGVQAIALLDEIRRGLHLPEIVQRQALFQMHTHTYGSTGDVQYILQRASAKGEQTVGRLGTLAARHLRIHPVIIGRQGQTEVFKRYWGKVRADRSLFHLAQRVLASGTLLAPHINFSFSGDLASIEAMPEWDKLQHICEQQGVSLHLSPMSMTNAMHIGPSSLSLGFIAQNFS